MPHTTQLAVFAKYWTPGRVKTRLAADLGDVAAADLYRVFVETTLARLSGITGQSVLCYSPPERRSEFEATLPLGWELMPQHHGDLGQRMEHAFETSFAAGIDRIVLIGSDCPAVPVGHIRQAFDLLDKNEIVLGPSGDGGYYLVGARGKTPPIFSGIDWSTDRVWQQTVDRLTRLGLRHKRGYATIPPCNDIDTLPDFLELRDHLPRQTSGNDDPALARLLDAVKQALRTS